ncbi:MAG TPA: redox-sensing transcriptional repressor Rex [Clostridiales bacterium]|nr:redox-sensing transcriptional repressor Rex [Clostridiales bacterium]
MQDQNISSPTLRRLPTYLNYLKSLPKDHPENISSAVIASALGLGEVQVRKDLACVCNKGKPKIGYIIKDLINCLEEFLGYNSTTNAVIVGAGKLGKALLDYVGFENYGLNIVAAFDKNPALQGKTETGKNIYILDKFEEVCKRLNIKIGIITVPAENAQEACDLMVKNGIVAIWNFAPVHLKVPDGVIIQHENIAASLALLSKRLPERINA